MNQSQPKLIGQEKQAIISLAGIYALRSLGLFMLIPILSLYAQTLQGATPFLIGVALGCYGLTQAVFQIPMGLSSDRLGRKNVIAFGLIIFAVGSVIAALTHSIYGVILGRCLQGVGAVGSVTTALLADLTRDEQRTKAMAAVGITIGVAFTLAMVLGPLLNGYFSVPIIFWITFLFALFALLILRLWVPNPQHLIQYESKLPRLLLILKDPKLFRLNIGILFLHIILTANFVVFPFILTKVIGLTAKQQWQVYLPALLLAFLSIIPLLRHTEKPQKVKKLFFISIAGLILAEILLWQLQNSQLEITLALWIFFTAFTLLEALIPSLVSKTEPRYRGAAMGVNSTCQFLGIFLGGIMGGWIYGHFTLNSVLIAGIFIAFVWFLIDIRKLPE